MTDYFFKDHQPSAMQGEARLRGLWDYFFKDHELLVIQGEARLHGLERNNDAKTISPRLWEAKPACAGQNRAPCSRSVRDATSGARASGAHPGRDAPAPQGLPRAQGGL